MNYVGALDLAAMERERPEVDAAIDRLFASHGDGVRRRPAGHAGGKWLARYASALGGNVSLELGLNYMARQPLCGAARMESRILGRVGTGRVLVLHEIEAGKIVALFDRGAARDLFDVRRILAIEGLDRGWIKAEGRELFDAAHDLLRSPIRTEKFVRDGHVAPPLKHSGESALAELTDLSPPPLDAFAVAASDWKTIAQTRGFVETGRGQAAHIVETWAYDPAGLSTARTVDPLSLYAHFRNHRDERVSMAAERLLKEIAW